MPRRAPGNASLEVDCTGFVPVVPDVGPEAKDSHV